MNQDEVYALLSSFSWSKSFSASCYELFPRELKSKAFSSIFSSLRNSPLISAIYLFAMALFALHAYLMRRALQGFMTTKLTTKLTTILILRERAQKSERERWERKVFFFYIALLYMNQYKSNAKSLIYPHKLFNIIHTLAKMLKKVASSLMCDLTTEI